jgi:pimeloyl-ACP methyl ester carboxylesterase
MTQLSAQDDTPHSGYFWTGIVIGLSVIVGFWATWFPLSIVSGLWDFFAHEGGGGDATHALHRHWRMVLVSISVAVTLIFPVIIFRHSIGAEFSARLSATFGAALRALVAMCILAMAGEVTYTMSWLFPRDYGEPIDPRRNSTNVANTLKRHPAFPLIGFWKRSCDEDVGIAIERGFPWLSFYRVESCIPYSCGLWGYSKIVNDFDYRVVDQNTLILESMPAPNEYHRCD